MYPRGFTAFRGGSAYDVAAASEEAAYVETMESKTVQSQRDDADINVIVRRFGLTGMLPQVRADAMFGDFTEVADFRQSLERARAIDGVWASLGPQVRTEFGNNVDAFLNYVYDPSRKKADFERLGLTEVPDNVGSAGKDAGASASAAGGGSAGDAGAAAGGKVAA